MKPIQEQLDTINEQLVNSLLTQESSTNDYSSLFNYSSSTDSSSNDLSSLFEINSQLNQLKALTAAKTNLTNQANSLQNTIEEGDKSSTTSSQLGKISFNLDLLNNQI